MSRFQFNPLTGTLDLVSLPNGGGGGGSSTWGGITGTLSDQTDLKAALDAKAEKKTTTAAYTFGTPTAATAAVAGTDTSAAMRIPFRLPRGADSWRVVIRSYGDPFQITGVYLGRANSSAVATNYNFAATPTTIGSMTSPGNTFISGWQSTPIAKNADYLLSYGWTAAVGANLNIAPTGGFLSQPASTADSVAATGGAPVFNGYFEVTLEYTVTGSNIPILVSIGHSLNVNMLPAGNPNGNVNAWTQMWAQQNNGIAVDLAQAGSLMNTFEAPYSLNRAVNITPPTLVTIWAASNSINAGQSVGDLITSLTNVVNNVRSLWADTNIYVMTEPKRSEIATGSAKDLVRISWNQDVLRAFPRGLGQIKVIDMDYAFSDPGSNTLYPKFASGDGAHQNYIGHVQAASLVTSGDNDIAGRAYLDTQFNYLNTIKVNQSTSTNTAEVYSRLNGVETMTLFSSVAGNNTLLRRTASGQATANPATVDGNLTTRGQMNDALALKQNAGDYATNTALTSGLATKQNSLTLTTSGTSGAATLVGSTLNIPQYSGGGGGGSGITRSILGITADVTGASTSLVDYIYYWEGSSPYTFTLPAAAGNTNRYTLKNSSTVTQAVSGSADITTIKPGDVYEFFSTVTIWRAI